MFDLHMHTNLSDGNLSVEKLLERLKSKNIKLFSITDHNHALAYNYINDESLNYIKGCELATSYNGVIIEILGYNIDHNIINDWYLKFYSQENLENNEIKLFNELKTLAKNLNYQIDEDLALETIEKGISKKTVFYNLFENNKDFKYKTYKSFFREGLSNPNSEFFVDEGRYYPSIKDVISLIHKAGGIAFLAHPYEYGIEDLNNLFKDLIKLNIDGIECFHPSASMVNSIKLVEYCESNNLLASGGSDFHRDNRLVPNGIYIHDDILKFKCFDWLKPYLD